MTQTLLESEIQRRGVSPTRLAKATGLSYRYLLVVRRGDCEPTVTRASKIARAMSKLTRHRYTVDDFWPTDDQQTEAA
jgi:predicted transcriptional regulator